MLVALAAGFAGCGDDDEEATPSEPPAQTQADGAGADSDGSTAVQAATVDIKGFRYAPPAVTVKAGGTVDWTNGDTAPHTATAEDDSFDTGSLDKGDAGKVTFDEAGTFSYICTFHPFMSGTVRVVQ